MGSNPLKGPVKGVVFDLDGTLVDSLKTTFEAFNHGIRLCGGREHSPEEIMAYFGPGEGEIFAKIVGQDLAVKAYTACRHYLDDHLADVPLHDGVLETLNELRARKLPLSIVTGRSWNTTEVILKHHGLLDRFITVIANDHVPLPKPAPLGIQLALKRMSFEPEEILYVGDSPVDIQASRSAGSRSVAALWDRLASQETLAAHDPHHWAHHPSELLELL
ncbi:MAG: HAD-IA family hydrolase [Bdellovibrionales bacterium]|nr:HAD-IA family hydrolase [Bdellovibrionales bacterium]